MIIKTAMILCGGLGTRLRSLGITEPKSMIKLKGIPFLSYLLIRLQNLGVQRAILLAGYGAKAIKDYYGNGFDKIEINYSIEGSPGGTGGAIRDALLAYSNLDERILITNGDTLLMGNDRIANMMDEREKISIIVIKNETDSDQFDVFKTDSMGYAVEIQKKCSYKKSPIGTGIYIVDSAHLRGELSKINGFFNFEDHLKDLIDEGLRVKCIESQGELIDIGTPSGNRGAEAYIEKHFGAGGIK